MRKLDAFAERAANAGADLVVFPELSLTGYACGDAFFDVAEPVPGPSTLHVCEVARDLGLHVVWGMPERGLPGVIYNAAVLVGPDGYIGTWRKHVLPGHATDLGGAGAFPDRRFFRSGNRSPVFDTAIGRIGLMVCYDIFFPEIARLLTLKGADLLGWHFRIAVLRETDLRAARPGACNGKHHPVRLLQSCRRRAALAEGDVPFLWRDLAAEGLSHGRDTVHVA